MLAIFKTGHFATCELRYGEAGEKAICRCKLKGFRWAIALAVVIFLGEFTGGIISGSLALLSDGWHVLSDIFVYGASVYALMLKLREVSVQAIHEIDKKWGSINASVLMTVATINIVLAIARFFSEQDHVLTGLMFWIATGGLLGNGVMLGLLLLLGLDHGHNHDHKGGAHNGKSWFAKLGGWIHGSAILHTAADMFISIIVVSAAYLMTNNSLKIVFGIEDWSHGKIDSIATIIISLILIVMAMHIKKEISHDHHH